MNEKFSDHTEEQAYRTAYLIAGFIRKTLSEKESDELDAWIVESDENLELFEKVTDEENIQIAMQEYLQLEKEKAEVLAKVKKTIGLKEKKNLVGRAWPYLVAACLIALAANLFLFRNSNTKTGLEKTIAQLPDKQNINAGSNKAILTLSDGRKIILDSTRTGSLATEGDISIKKGSDGEIIYNGTSNEMKYNLVSTPRGGQYKLILGDGTIVWLNAESSLKFPAGFAATNREVELSGEGYFEVAKNERPFKVKILTSSGDEGTVEVLGTHFNVNGYSDEELVKTTLLEGSIRIDKNGKSKIIKPGEQALISNEIKVVKANVTEEIAWKDGKFLFRDATIHSIAEQIKRWYDVEIIYQGNVLDHFNAEIDRNVPLQELLDLLEGTGRVHFSLEGKKLIIKP